MKAIVFDTGPIISMAMTNTLWILEELKKNYKGKFYITPEVKYEIIDRPLKSKRFKFEAMQVLRLLENNVLTLIDPTDLGVQTETLLESANSMYCSKRGCIKVLQRGEVETVAAAIILEADAIVIDERTTRIMIERPEKLKEILERKTKAKISIKDGFLRRWKENTYGINVIRSTELATIAFEKGFFKGYVPHLKNANREFLDGLLWGLRLNGCSISSREIAKIPRLIIS